MAWTTTDRDNVKAAIMALATGARVVSVSFPDGKAIQYHQADLAKLQELLTMIETSIPAATRPKQFHAYHRSKGF